MALDEQRRSRKSRVDISFSELLVHELKSLMSDSALQAELRGLLGCRLTCEAPALLGRIRSEHKDKVEV